MFVFSVARPFVCGCHVISTLPSARTIPGLPGSLASLLHRVARTHLGAMGWNQCAFAPIVRARPFPIFGRPVHPRDGSRRLRPGGSPHALQTPPRGGRPALQSFRSWLQLCLGRIRLSPSCPFRHLHYLSTLRPVRHYPHLLDIDPWPRAERDFNPPKTRAARHALSMDLPPSAPCPLRNRRSRLGFPTSGHGGLDNPMSFERLGGRTRCGSRHRSSRASRGKTRPLLVSRPASAPFGNSDRISGLALSSLLAPLRAPI